MNNSTLYWCDFLARIGAKKQIERIMIYGYLPQKKDSILFEKKHHLLTILSYATRNIISENTLLKAFEHPNAKEILSAYIVSRELPRKAEIKLLQTPEMEDITKKYLSLNSLCEEAQEVLFTLPNAEELLEIYITSEKCNLSQTSQLKLFELKDSTKFLKLYTQENILCDKAEIRLVDHPDFEEIFDSYPYMLDNEVLSKLFARPETEKFLLKYAEDCNNLDQETEAKLFDFPSSTEILMSYINGTALHDENEPLLLKLSDKERVITEYLSKYNVSPLFIDKVLTSPESETLLPLVLKTTKLTSEQELRLFEQNNAQELLLLYIENNELSEEAQLQLLKMPKKDADPIMRKYAQKYEFSRIFRQTMAIDTYLLH